MFEILHLVRSWRNTAAPINRIPPEVLTLIPNFWDRRIRDQNLITITHVCRAWREGFTSQRSLWTDLDCVGLEKTRTYLERSKTSPINVSIYRHTNSYMCSFSRDPFIQIATHVIERLNSLTIEGSQWNLKGIIAHLGRPAPLLEYLSIVGSYGGGPEHNPMLARSDFGGDLSSLRRLCLEYVNTELPWRNMVNLTSFRLVRTLPLTVGQILDFLESAPHLRKVEIHSKIQTSGTQNGRLVSLARLKRMVITGGESSPLLDHMLIPAGARLAAWVELPDDPIEGHPPRFFNNLKNFPGFTTINLYGSGMDSDGGMQFSGPNGEVTITPTITQADETSFLLESLTQFDTSKTERLKIYCINSLPGDPPRQALLPMKDLRTLTLYDYANTHDVIRALDPSACSSGVVVCPKLEELVISQYGEPLDTQDVIEMAAARASRGVKLKSVWIDTPFESVQTDALELKRHVLHVKCGPEVDGPSGDGGGNYEED